MSSVENIALMAHLMRRAGFGASRTEIEKLAKLDYESVVESMLVPPDDAEVDLATLYRYHPASERTQNLGSSQLNWLYRMVTTTNPLREKIRLFEKMSSFSTRNTENTVNRSI